MQGQLGIAMGFAGSWGIINKGHQHQRGEPAPQEGKLRQMGTAQEAVASQLSSQ